MKGNDGDKLRLEASKLFTYLCSKNDRIAIVEFGNSAKIITPLSNLTIDEKKKVCEKIDRISHNQKHTSIHSALKMAAELIPDDVADHNIKRSRVVILLTDGKIKGNDDLPPGVSTEVASAVIDSSLSELKRKEAKVICIGLGKDFDRELIQKISLASGGTVYESENPEFLINIFKNIFMNISGRFIYEKDFNDKSINFKYNKFSLEKDVNIVIANKNKQRNKKVSTTKRITLNSTPVVPAELLNEKLFELIALAGISHGVIDVMLEFTEAGKYQLMIIKNIGIDVIIQKPDFNDQKFYKNDRIDLEYKISRSDGASLSDLKLSSNVIVVLPDGSSIEIKTSGTPTLYNGSFTPTMHGLHIFKFVTRLDDDSRIFTNSKEFLAYVNPKDNIELMKTEPAGKRVTKGSEFKLAVKVLKDGTNLTSGELEKMHVISVHKPDSSHTDENKLTQNAEGNFETSIRFNDIGSQEVKIFAEGSFCVPCTLSVFLDATDRPLVKIIEPSSDKITPFRTAKIKADISMPGASEVKACSISGTACKTSDKETLNFNFFQSREKNNYIADFKFKDEGVYIINAAGNIDGENTAAEPKMSYIFDIENPKIKIKQNKLGAGALFNLNCSLMPENGQHNKKASVKARVTNPVGTVIELGLKDDGNITSGDQKSGDGVYSANFSETVFPGTYKILFSISYPNLAVSENIRNINSKTVSLDIKYSLNIADSIKTKHKDGNYIFDVGSFTLGGCEEAGEFEVLVKTVLPGKHFIKFDTRQIPHIDLYLLHKNQKVNQFKAKLNSSDNGFKFSYKVRNIYSSEKITFPLKIKFIDEKGMEYDDMVYITGNVTTPFSYLWMLILIAACLFILIKLWPYFMSFEYSIHLYEGDTLLKKYENSEINSKYKFGSSICITYCENATEVSDIIELNSKNGDIIIKQDINGKYRLYISDKFDSNYDVIKKIRMEDGTLKELDSLKPNEISGNVELILNRHIIKLIKI
jgi:hypothetical protein